MFQPIEKCVRLALVSGSSTIAIRTLLVVPLAGSTSDHNSGPSTGPQQAIVQRDDPWRNAMVKVVRDPFLPEPTSTKSPMRPSRLTGNRSAVGIQVTEASVRGVAFGQKPKAVIEVGGATKIVAPGDFISGMRVAAILPDRIILIDGSVLMLSRKLP